MHSSVHAGNRITLRPGHGDAVWRAQVGEFLKRNKGRTVYSRKVDDHGTTEVSTRDGWAGGPVAELKAARREGANLLTALDLLPSGSRLLGTLWGARKRAKRAAIKNGAALRGRNGSKYVMGSKLGSQEKPLWHATDLAGGPVVVKELSDDVEGWQEVDTNLRLSKLAHENILGCRDVGMKDGKPMLVMESAPHGVLSELMETAHVLRQADPKTLKADLCWIRANLDAIFLLILQDALQGLAAMHSLGLMHLDVRLENIFIGEGFVGKIGDFGTSKVEGRVTERCMMAAHNLAPEQNSGNVWLASRLQARENLRSRLQGKVQEGKLSLESAKQKLKKFDGKTSGYELTTAADMYAVGLLAHKLFHGEDLVSAADLGVREQAIVVSWNKAKAPLNSPVNHRLKSLIDDLVNACKQRASSRRPTAPELLKHPAFGQLRDEARVTELRQMMKVLSEQKSTIAVPVASEQS